MLGSVQQKRKEVESGGGQIRKVGQIYGATEALAGALFFSLRETGSHWRVLMERSDMSCLTIEKYQFGRRNKFWNHGYNFIFKTRGLSKAT